MQSTSELGELLKEPRERLCGQGTSTITCLPQGPPRDQADASGSTPHNPRQGARGDGESRPRARARVTASVRRCTPSLAKMWRMCVRTVCTDKDSSRATSGADKLVGRYRSTRTSLRLSGSI